MYFCKSNHRRVSSLEGGFPPAGAVSGAVVTVPDTYKLVLRTVHASFHLYDSSHCHSHLFIAFSFLSRFLFKYNTCFIENLINCDKSMLGQPVRFSVRTPNYPEGMA